MARNLDKHKDLLAEFAQVSADYTKVGREYRDLEARKKRINAELTKIMGTSKVGTVDGKEVLETYNYERESVNIERVEQFAPKLRDKLVVNSITPKVRFIKGI